MHQNNVWFDIGIISIYGASLDTDMHAHQSIQIIWPDVNRKCQLNGKPQIQAVVINSGVEHQLLMESGWVLLIEPKSLLGQQLLSLLQVQHYYFFSIDLVSKQQIISQDLTSSLAPLFSALNITTTKSNTSVVADKRIEALLVELDKCISGHCIKPSSWRARDVANQVSLSEGRFLHLFREKMGIAWRPYLLWRRMLCAMQAMLRGASATEAAHYAGFCDSAHLSRTFRRTFGITIRQAQHIFKNHS